MVSKATIKKWDKSVRRVDDRICPRKTITFLGLRWVLFETKNVFNLVLKSSEDMDKHLTKKEEKMLTKRLNEIGITIINTENFRMEANNRKLFEFYIPKESKICDKIKMLIELEK